MNREHWSKVLTPHNSFAKKGNKEAISHIHDRYKKAGSLNILVLSLIESLQKLEYENALNLLREYAQKSFNALPDNNLSYKKAVRILFTNEDYLQFNNIVDLIKEKANSQEGDDGYLYTLSCASEGNQYRDNIINTMIFVLQNYQDSDSRMLVALYAKQYPKSTKLHQALKKAITDDPSFDVRWWSLVRLKDTYNDAELLDLALNNLNETNNPDEIDRYLSIITGEYDPQSLFLIKDLKNNNPNELVREEAAEIYDDYWWLHFEPYGKAIKYSLSQTLGSLNAYTNDIASYDWLGDQGFVRELTNRLDNASRYLAQGDSSNTAKQVGNYKEWLKEVHEQSQQNNSPRFVTEDGYKFLTKNAEYLLTQLPGHPSNENKER